MNKEQLAHEYANKVAAPFLRSMMSMSRGVYADILGKAVEYGYDKGRESALKWIAVTPETMPEAFKSLQFYLKTESMLTGYYHKSGCFLEKGESYTYQIDDISHWRYLDTTPPEKI